MESSILARVIFLKRHMSRCDERRHGYWITRGGKMVKNVDNRIVECSVCNNYLSMSGVNGGRGDANYCPNCGAAMDEEARQDD